MNVREQAYINGFVKRASEYGLDYFEALSLLKSAYSYSDEMGEMNRWLDGGSPWSNRLNKDFYKDPKGVAALTKNFTDIVRSQGADVKFLSDSYYDDKTIKMSPEETINKLLAQKELKFNADDAPNYYQIMYPFEQIGKFKWKDDKHPSQLSIDEYLKTLNTKTADSAASYSNDSCRPKNSKKEKKNEKSAAPVMRLPAAKPTAHRNQVAPMKAQSKMIAPIKASPEMPYAETRATLEDLASFPISEDDFLKGGGKLMFQDPVKTPAAVPTVAQQ